MADSKWKRILYIWELRLLRPRVSLTSSLGGAKTGGGEASEGNEETMNSTHGVMS